MSWSDRLGGPPPAASLPDNTSAPRTAPKKSVAGPEVPEMIGRGSPRGHPPPGGTLAPGAPRGSPTDLQLLATWPSGWSAPARVGRRYSCSGAISSPWRWHFPEYWTVINVQMLTGRVWSPFLFRIFEYDKTKWEKIKFYVFIRLIYYICFFLFLFYLCVVFVAHFKKT